MEDRLLNEINRSREMIRQKPITEEKFRKMNFSDMKNWSTDPRKHRDQMDRRTVIEILKSNYTGYRGELENIFNKWMKKTQEELNLTDEEIDNIEWMFVKDNREGLDDSSLMINSMGMDFSVFDEIPRLQGETSGPENYYEKIRKILLHDVDEKYYDEIELDKDDIYNRFFLNNIPAETVVQELIDNYEEKYGQE